jgi:hypothetical protein
MTTLTVAHAQDTALPHLVTQDGHHALIVDGQPFLMLGAQANNSSNYPEPLKKVWPVIEQMDANTLEIPVAWEQIEPQEGQFDFSWLDTLLPRRARMAKGWCCCGSAHGRTPRPPMRRNG